MLYSARRLSGLCLFSLLLTVVSGCGGHTALRSTEASQPARPAVPAISPSLLPGLPQNDEPGPLMQRSPLRRGSAIVTMDKDADDFFQKTADAVADGLAHTMQLPSGPGGVSFSIYRFS